MMISEREAAKRLGVLAGLTRTPARRLLRTGIAGGTPYEMERVDEVGRRRIPDDGLLRNVTTIGLLQLRLAPDQLWRTEWPAGRKLDVMREGRPTGFVRLIQLVALVRHHGPLPMIATVSGFVVGGADVVEPVINEGRLALAEPGPWFAHLESARWWSSRGGSPLQWYEAQLWRERAS